MVSGSIENGTGSDEAALLSSEFAPRSQHPNFDARRERSRKPSSQDVLVIALGSHFVRYGPASSSAPRKVRTLVAFEKSAGGYSSPSMEKDQDDSQHLETEFQSIVEQISADCMLHERRRGGGKPVPWSVEIESVDGRSALEEQSDPAEIMSTEEENRSSAAVLVGRSAEKVLHGVSGGKRRHEVVPPIVDGRLGTHSGFSTGLVRAALDAILSFIGNQFHANTREQVDADENKNAEVIGPDKPNSNMHSLSVSKKLRRVAASTSIALIVPDSSDRSDVAEFVSAIFRVDELRAAAIFVHHNSVSCSFGAGLPSCVAVDIGHSSTTVCCVDEGSVIADSRVYLNYGCRCIKATFEKLLKQEEDIEQVLDAATSGAQGAQNATADAERMDLDSGCGRSIEDDVVTVCARACEQLCSLNVDENDTLGIAMVRVPSTGQAVRVKCGVGIRSVPAYGMFYPRLFEILSKMNGFPTSRTEIPTVERNSDEDNFMQGLFDDVKRSTIVSAAKPFGVFSNETWADAGAHDDDLDSRKSSLVDAVIWSVDRAVVASAAAQGDSSRGSDLKKRLYNSILLAGGGSFIDGLAVVLESRLRREFEERKTTLQDVNVIDGARGKGDKELLAATAFLTKNENGDDRDNDLNRDGDMANLAWKGGAVMVEADGVKDLWVYRDEWEARGIRSLRERVPFYW